MSLPKEPRQKMINIMYLVLTALLALNVSSEILNAFKTIDQSLMNANVIIQKKNQDIYTSLEAKLNHYHPGFKPEEIDTTHGIVRVPGLQQRDITLFNRRQYEGKLWGKSWEL